LEGVWVTDVELGKKPSRVKTVMSKGGALGQV